MSTGLSGALRAGVVVLLSSAAVAAYALPFTRGNVIVSGTPTTVKEFTPAGVLVQTLPAAGSGAFTTGMCFDSSGKLLLTLFSDGAVALYNTDGTLATASFITAPGEPEACVRDAAGNFYVTSVTAVAAIRKYSSTGTLLQTFLPGTRSDWMDLGTDQCTMYWDDEGTSPAIHRFNVCSGTALPVLGGSGTFTALRVHPGTGDILVANSSTNRVDRFSSAGTLLGSWIPTGILGVIFALNLDPDGLTFWTGGTGGSVHRFAIATFAPQISTFNSGNANLFGLSVVGEITTGGPATGPAEVPTLSQWALIALALMLAGGAALGLRRRHPKI
jgi:WD40 repeat protein